jgi:hypothetical protein
MRAVVLASLAAGCSFGAKAAVTDAHVQLDAAADAPPDAAVHCLASGACHRKAIRAVAVTGGPHADFVMLVSLDHDDDLLGRTGPELQFTDAGGAPLAYERTRFSPSSGALIAWVRVPSLAIGTTIYVWWGGTDGVDHQDVTGTWSGYAGVWHLDETTGTTLRDTTANHNDGTAINGANVGAAGWIGQGIGFDGNNDYLRVPASTSLSATTGEATFALWIHWTSVVSTDYQRVLTSSNRFMSSGNGYEWAAQPQGPFYLYPWGGAEDYDLGPSPFTAGQWQYLVATLDFATKTVSIYVDAVPMTFSSTNTSLWAMPGAPADWDWGDDPIMGGPFAGSMDEIRVMSGVRTPGWVATSFANQHDPASFYMLGAAETLTP